MVFVLERPELENIIEQEEIIFVIPKEEIKIKEIDEKIPEKKSSLFKKHNRDISINDVKRKLDTNLYRNRIAMR